jgi:hypothetical protein
MKKVGAARLLIINDFEQKNMILTQVNNNFF